MNTSLGLNILALLVVILLTRTILSAVQQRQVPKLLAELAAQKGWQLEKSPSTFVDCLLRGQSADSPWEMKYINQEQTTGRQKTASIVWSSEAAKSPASSILICPKLANLPSSAVQGSETGQLILQGMLQRAGLNASDLRLQTAGSTLFQAKYLVMAADPALAEKVVANVETALLNWPATSSPYSKPSLWVDANGVQTRINRTGTSASYQYQVAEPLIQLGLAAVNAIK
jgi:hypothetical protein